MMGFFQAYKLKIHTLLHNTTKFIGTVKIIGSINSYTHIFLALPFEISNILSNAVLQLHTQIAPGQSQKQLLENMHFLITKEQGFFLNLKFSCK